MYACTYVWHVRMCGMYVCVACTYVCVACTYVWHVRMRYMFNVYCGVCGHLTVSPVGLEWVEVCGV